MNYIQQEASPDEQRIRESVEGYIGNIQKQNPLSPVTWFANDSIISGWFEKMLHHNQLKET